MVYHDSFYIVVGQGLTQTFVASDDDRFFHISRWFSSEFDDCERITIYSYLYISIWYVFFNAQKVSAIHVLFYMYFQASKFLIKNNISV